MEFRLLSSKVTVLHIDEYGSLHFISQANLDETTHPQLALRGKQAKLIQGKHAPNGGTKLSILSISANLLVP